MPDTKTITVTLNPLNFDGDTWGLKAWIWDQLRRAGIPLMVTTDIYADPRPSRGVLHSIRLPTGEFQFTWKGEDYDCPKD